MPRHNEIPHRCSFSCILRVAPPSLDPPKKNARVLPRARIVVTAGKINGSVEYTIGKLHYSKDTLYDAIGEKRLSSSPDSEVIIVLEDTMSSSDIKEVPRMALDAGFTDIRVFVYWKVISNNKAYKASHSLRPRAKPAKPEDSLPPISHLLERHLANRNFRHLPLTPR